MMKRLAMLPVFALVLAACSESTTTGLAPSDGPSFLTIFSSSTAPTGAHYANGSFEPVCGQSGLAISCSGTQINGVGNTNANLNLSVAYLAVVDCRNNGGKIVPVKAQLTSAAAVSLDIAAKNGALVVPSIATDEEDVPTAAEFEAQAVCPNGNWTREAREETIGTSGFVYLLTFVGFPDPAISIVSP
jgi:hypothetical protein